MDKRFHIRNERGQTFVEFAFILPILCLLLFAVIQFGIAFNNYLTVTDAARAGARKSVAALYNGAGDGVAAGTSGAKASAGHLDDGKLKVTVVAIPSWEEGDVKVTVTYPYKISLIGIPVKSGLLTGETTERIEGGG